MRCSAPLIVAYRSDVRHNQHPQAFWILEGKGHRHFAAHAVSQQNRVGEGMVVEVGQNICCHARIVHCVAVGRIAVVPQVEQVDLALAGELVAKAPPVGVETEQTVQHDKSRPGFAQNLCVQGKWHVGNDQVSAFS